MSSNTQSASSTKRFKSAYSQATLLSFMDKRTREEIVAKLVKMDLSAKPSAIKVCIIKKIRIMLSNLYINNMKLQKNLL